MLKISHIKITYAILVTIYHFFIFTTDVGNYYHGGTVWGRIALQGLAVFIIAICVKSLPAVNNLMKPAVILCTIMPAIDLISYFYYAFFIS